MRFAVLGDLHLDLDDARFARAREQLRAAEPAHAVCLGDFGCGSDAGTPNAFEAARTWLARLGVPFDALLGNHDLERIELFASDQAAVECFCAVMNQEKPYRAFDLGPALGITLSSTGFRDNRGYVQEVWIDDEQLRWFAETLEHNATRPTFVFSHAPPLGSRLRVLQVPHLRAGNAWLNQSNGPRRFSELLARHPQVRLWFSAHNHLGQDHARALSHVGHCLFVHTGVIGAQSRDGRHQSRLVSIEGSEVSIETLDHASGARRCDATFDFASNTVRRFASEPAALQAPFLSAPTWDDVGGGRPPIETPRGAVVWSQGMWIEFDRELAEPVGVVWEGDLRRPPRFEDGCLTLGPVWQRRRIPPNDDGYSFRIPSRDRSSFERTGLALRGLAARLGIRNRGSDANRPTTPDDSA